MEPNKLFTHKRLSDFVNNYKDFVEKKKEEAKKLDPSIDEYSYYHFTNNPDGVIIDSIGRFGQNILSAVSSWSPMKNKNSIDSWRINLARGLVKFRESEFNMFQSKKQPGLNFIINYDELPNGMYYGTPNMNIDQRNFAYQSSIKQTDRGTDNSKLGVTNDFSSLQSATNNKLTSENLFYKLVSVDWYGLFLGKSGNYTITCNATNCLFFIWLGDNAVCQFMNDNSNVNNNKTTSDRIVFPYDQFKPIRIQIYYFGNIQSKVTFSLQFNRILLKNGNEITETYNFNSDKPVESSTFVLPETGNILNNARSSEIATNKNISNVDASSESTESYVPIRINDFLCNVPSYEPLILYIAFVSDNQQDFLKNLFLCYSMVEFKNDTLVVKDYVQLGIFYQNIRMFMSNVLANKYDYNDSNRLTYGILPPINIQYTINEPGSSSSSAMPSVTNGAPFAFSLYKLNSDYRMGKIFQIKGSLNQNFAYPMNQMGDEFINANLSYANDYQVYPGYYPNSSAIDVNYFNKAVNKNELQCKEECNNSTNCGYYFAYSSNGNNKCIIDTQDSVPVFNRVPPKNTNEPVDEGSQSLYIRNYQFDLSYNPQKCLSLNSKEQNQRIPIVNTSNYSNTFKYSDYNLDGSMKIQSPQEMGLCGNKDYIKKVNEAEKILFKDTTYYKDGEYIENFDTKIPDSKYTDAVQDTSDGIRTNLNNQMLYAEKQQSINDNNETINKIIYDYELARDKVRVDEELYATSSIHKSGKTNGPKILKKRIMDNNDLYLSSKLLFTLGTLTASTLIVFAIILARD